MNNNTLNQYIAKRIRYLRLNQNLTQEELSEKAGLGINYINNIENKFLNIKIDTLDKIIEALDLSPIEFFNFPPSQNNQELNQLFEDLNELPKDKQLELLNAITILINLVKTNQ